MPPVKKGWWYLTDDLRLTLNSPAGTQVLTSLEIRRGQHPVRTTLPRFSLLRIHSHRAQTGFHALLQFQGLQNGTREGFEASYTLAFGT